MNDKQTFATFDENNRIVAQSVSFDVTKSVRVADMSKQITGDDYTVHDVTADSYSIQVYSTATDYSKIKTVIYNGYNGCWYVSNSLWNDASYCFQHRKDHTCGYTSLSGVQIWYTQEEEWLQVTQNREILAFKLNLNPKDLPDHPNEYIELIDGKLRVWNDN